MAFSQDELDALKLNLEELSVQLSKDVESAKLGSQPVALDQQAVGRVSRIDAIQQQQMQLSGLRRMEQRLASVRGALDRWGSDNFGVCSRCEEPISIERLKVRPESQICITCAKKVP